MSDYRKTDDANSNPKSPHKINIKAKPWNIRIVFSSFFWRVGGVYPFQAHSWWSWVTHPHYSSMASSLPLPVTVGSSQKDSVSVHVVWCHVKWHAQDTSTYFTPSSSKLAHSFHNDKALTKLRFIYQFIIRYTTGIHQARVFRTWKSRRWDCI